MQMASSFISIIIYSCTQEGYLESIVRTAYSHFISSQEKKIGLRKLTA